MPLYGKFGDLCGSPLAVPRRGRPVHVALARRRDGADVPSPVAAWRAVQGLGGGGLMILSQAIIADIVPASDRGKYMGPMGALFGISAVIGPAPRRLAHRRPRLALDLLDQRTDRHRRVRHRLVRAEAALAPLRHARPTGGGILSMALATYRHRAADRAGSRSATTATTGPTRCCSACCSAPLASVGRFIVIENRAPEPLIPLRLFKNRTFTITTLIGLVLGMGMFSAMAMLPTFLQMSTGAGVTESGLLMLPMMAGMMLTAIGSGIAISKTGRYKIFPVAGLAIIDPRHDRLADHDRAATCRCGSSAPMIFVLGAGMGLVMQTIVLAVQNSVDPHELGTATSSNNFFREIGATRSVRRCSPPCSPSRLTDNLQGPGRGWPPRGRARRRRRLLRGSLTPAAVEQLPEPLHTGSSTRSPTRSHRRSGTSCR